MSDWPVNITSPLVTIHPWSLEAIGEDLTAQAKYLSAAAGTAFPTVNLGYFIPFTLAKQIIAQKMFWYNGSVVNTTYMVCVGVYDQFGNQIWTSGNIAQSTASVIQTTSMSVATATFGPGQFYLAISCNTTTATFFATSMAANIFPALTGMAQMASANPLPTTATFAQIAGNYIPIVGLTTRIGGVI
jgi:hypothetical protein